MKKIRLPGGEWFYDPKAPLGAEGGFGVVFCGSAEAHGPLAIKRLKIDAKQAAHREMRLAEELARREFAHVIPILDAGLDAESNSYFVVMPRAEKSLQDELNAGSLFDDQAAAEVLSQIAEGLSEVPNIVHRDLKPGNILYHDGGWKVADFGIARFVEESTSLQTLKDCLTPSYAAPEQWQYERSTAATDIYALGCIGYAVLTGHPPFRGPNLEDSKRQHLHEKPPTLKGHDPQLCSMLSSMLRKRPQARPSLGRVMNSMQKIAAPEDKGPPSGALDDLARAGASVAERQAQEEAKREQERSAQESRERLAADAVESLEEIVERMIEEVLASAATAQRTGKLGVSLGGARLWVDLLNRGRALPRDRFPYSGWDVVAGGKIQVCQSRPDYTWSASLWFTDRGSGDEYRWWEVSYYVCVPMNRPRREDQPFALDSLEDADFAVSNRSHIYAGAEGPKPIDGEDEEPFFERWCGRLAKASASQLGRPNRLPID